MAIKKKEIDFSVLYDEKIAEYVQRRDPDSYSARRIALEVQEFKIPNLLTVLPKGFKYESVAEIGCATGELIATFPGASIKLRVGFDLSRMNIDAAKARFPGTTFRCDDFRSYSEHFDLIIVSDVLEHVPDDVQFLRDAAKLGRLVLVNLPLEKCLTSLFRNYGPEDLSGHLRKYSFADGMRLFEEAGLAVIEFQQVWVMESRYELQRQRLNKAMLGSEFRGNAPVRFVKQTIFNFCNAVKTVGRVTFPSNLFASAQMRTKKQ
jgi:SAM-dependent methyltransferase